MDRLIYVAMTGAQQLLEKQAVAAHNLANASTPGYKADISAFRAVPMTGPGQPTRTYAVETTPGADFTQGTVTETGRDLDAAINGPGFFAVQTTSGTEAYTRAGGFSVSAEGELTDAGRTVMGDGGPIAIPENSKVSLDGDDSVRITSGAIESSNVNAVSAMVDMIDLARQFDMQMKALSTVDQNE